MTPPIVPERGVPLTAETVVVPVEKIAACKGEQYDFEEWAKSRRYDMSEHPLHYIFNDPKTDPARMGWNAALAYVRDTAEPLSAAPAREPEGGAVKGPGDYTMVLTEPQAFEAFPALASHIERMAVGRSVGSLIEWDAFLHELNAALTPKEAPAATWAGEREAIARIIDPAAFLFSTDELMKGDSSQFNALSKADRILALRAQPQAREEAQPVAWVPIHPRNGPLWPETGPNAREKENLKSYPFRAVYFTPPSPEAEKLRIALEEAADAVDFFDRVKAATGAERTAVGSDHWKRMEAALRALAALQQEGSDRDL